MEFANNHGDKQLLSLDVTQEQYDAIKELFTQRGWEWTPGVRETSESSPIDSNSGSVTGPPINPHIAGQHECPHCLCSPCITSEQFRQLWWPQNSVAPHDRNSGLRKKNYYKFWGMLKNRGIWEDPRYQQRKIAAMPQRISYIFHKRELMPDCVIKLVRYWHPNVASQPYLGHTWE